MYLESCGNTRRWRALLQQNRDKTIASEWTLRQESGYLKRTRTQPVPPVGRHARLRRRPDLLARTRALNTPICHHCLPIDDVPEGGVHCCVAASQPSPELGYTTSSLLVRPRTLSRRLPRYCGDVQFTPTAATTSLNAVRV
jgi:hypothetical protein